MRRFVGPALIVIGVAHILTFAVLHADRWRAIARDGLVNTVDGDDKREAAFWAICCGPLMIMVGYLVHFSRTRLGTVPAFPGWVLLAMGLLGGLLMPVSPFWLFVPLGLAILRRPAPRIEPSPVPNRPATLGRGHGDA